MSSSRIVVIEAPPGGLGVDLTMVESHRAALIKASSAAVSSSPAEPGAVNAKLDGPTLVVSRVREDSLLKGEIEVGDRIISLDGEDARGMTVEGERC